MNQIDDEIIRSAQFLADPQNANRPDRAVLESEHILMLRRIANSTPPDRRTPAPTPSPASRADAEAALAAELLAAYFIDEPEG